MYYAAFCGFKTVSSSTTYYLGCVFSEDLRNWEIGYITSLAGAVSSCGLLVHDYFLICSAQPNASSVNNGIRYYDMRFRKLPTINIAGVNTFIKVGETMAIKVNGKLVAGAGKSAYESAKDGGYTGTEDEFNTSLVNSVTVDGGGVMSMNESFGAAQFTLTFTEDGEIDVSASKITYDNTESGMTATNVQDAITELSTAPKGGPGVPVGSVFWLAAQTAPEGYLICNGSAVCRTEYADLFAAIGTTFGTGDGSTTFALPNLQAAFIRGAGSQDGYSATFGQKQEATTIEVSNTDLHILASPIQYVDKWISKGTETANRVDGTEPSYAYNSSIRPYNIALTPIIKY